MPVVESAQKATIFGVHLNDKLLFAHPSPPLHVAIVIALTVVVSATTTFMTVRQSAKRGLMQTNVDPDNPMAQSQKYMQYIVPFFSLTGLYWQYGLVLYWVTTNLWTLGQQYFMFRNWDARSPSPPRARRAARHRRPGADRAELVPVRSSGRRSGASRQASARPAGAPRRRARRPAARTAASGARTGTASGRTAAPGRLGPGQGRQRIRRPPGPGPRTGRPPAGGHRGAPATGQNGAEKRGLLRLGRAKAEPEPQDDVPATKVVRQQPVRQAKSKRSGKR